MAPPFPFTLLFCQRRLEAVASSAVFALKSQIQIHPALPHANLMLSVWNDAAVRPRPPGRSAERCRSSPKASRTKREGLPRHTSPPTPQPMWLPHSVPFSFLHSLPRGGSTRGPGTPWAFTL